MKKSEVTRLHIGQLGNLEITVPIISVGLKGSKRVVILCGMHGDEKSGLFVVNELLQKFPSPSALPIQVDIVLAANPLAQALHQRVSPNDFHDLNRVFPGYETGDFTQRLALKIFNFCLEADAVIDLHTFQDIAPVIAIFMNSGSEETRAKTRNLINTFSPNAVWHLDFSSNEEAKLSGALGPVLANKGVPNIAVEMPECTNITADQIQKVAMGINRIINQLATDGLAADTNISVCPVFKRKRIRTDRAGLFIPSKNIPDQVTAGDTVGTLVTLPDFEHISVVSPWEGTLLVIHPKDLVSTSDDLFSVGLV